MEDHKSRAAKAFEAVEKAAKTARGTVISAQRNARAENKRAAQEKMAREAKRLKREEGLYNDQIAEKLGVAESSVRALLMMKVEGDI